MPHGKRGHGAVQLIRSLCSRITYGQQKTDKDVQYETQQKLFSFHSLQRNSVGIGRIGYLRGCSGFLPSLAARFRPRLPTPHSRDRRTLGTKTAGYGGNCAVKISQKVRRPRPKHNRSRPSNNLKRNTRRNRRHLSPSFPRWVRSRRRRRPGVIVPTVAVEPIEPAKPDENTDVENRSGATGGDAAAGPAA